MPETIAWPPSLWTAVTAETAQLPTLAGQCWNDLAVVATGSFGDTEPVGNGVLELRIRWGPGYRLYFARLGDVVVLLLGGGDKRTQAEDIRNAKKRFEDFKQRSDRARP